MDYSIAILQLIIFLFSVIIHEISHGYVAEILGDPTARREGRLTLNPISHIDPMGSIVLPLLLFISGLPIFGWAQPVPYNP
ncbi:MAG: site-2 protease family protein, partial [Parcubacteria group bacterium]|nr:site-2 protease family protein [Parcubacteria group bacterium]